MRQPRPPTGRVTVTLAAKAVELTRRQDASALDTLAVGCFDDARLDTLFLAMPIAWKGTMVQYVGRLQRILKGCDSAYLNQHDSMPPEVRRVFRPYPSPS